MAQNDEYRSVPVFGYKDRTTGQLRKDQAGNIIMREAPEGFVFIGIVPQALAMVGWPGFAGVLEDLSDECGPVTLPTPTFSFKHYDEVADAAPVLPYSYRGGFDTNNCEKLTFWLGDTNRPNVPQPIGITCDGQIVAWVTAQISRPDVKNALTASGIAGITSTLFGGEWYKPATFKDGQEHEWGIVGEFSTGSLNVDYNVARKITCNPPSNPQTPYVIQYQIVVQSSITKGGAAIVASIRERLSDDSRRPYSGSTNPVWSVTNAPAGISLTPNNTDKTVSIQALNTATVNSLELKLAIGSAQAVPETIQVLSSTCQRPANLTTLGAAWNFAPTGGNAVEFTTLDDANTKAGQKFDNTVPGNLATFNFQTNSLAIGETVYLGTGTDCGKVGDGIFYVLDSYLGNTVKKAMQVSAGVIVALKESSYVTPTLVINRMGIFYPTGWHSVLPSSGAVSENLVLLVNVSGTNGANATVHGRYLQSRNDNSFGAMQKIDYANNSGPNALPAGYTHYTTFNDELFSNNTKTFQAKLTAVANSTIEAVYFAPASTVDHTNAQIYPTNN